MSNKPTYDVFTTPVGRANYPFISKPDTQFDVNGVFKVDVSIPEELAGEFISRLEDSLANYVATLPAAQQATLTQKPVFKPELTRPEYPEDATDEQKKAIKDSHIPEPTGNVLFRCKMKHKVITDKYNFQQVPEIVDAETDEPVTSPVYDGSMIRVKGQIVPYTNIAAGQVGLTLRMKAVQVHDLVTGDGSNEEGFWTSFDE